MTRSRADSQFSVHTAYNNNLTPLQRQNSTISVDSSVYSEGNPPPNLGSYQFASAFDQRLLDFYNAYINQPSVTPFDHNFPPSGILSIISKSFLSQYEGQIDVRSSVNEDLRNSPALALTVIRMRLLNLIQNDLEVHSLPLRPQAFYRTDSIVSMESGVDMVNLPQFLPSTQLQTPPGSFSGPCNPPLGAPPPIGSALASNGSSCGSNGSNGPNGSNGFCLASAPTLASAGSGLPPPLPTLDFTIKRKHSAGQGTLVQPPPPLGRDYFSVKSPSLYSPYEQSFPSPLGAGSSPLVPSETEIKTTFMRKRDSLNLKRNGG